jgi:hypothetical protein
MGVLALRNLLLVVLLTVTGCVSLSQMTMPTAEELADCVSYSVDLGALKSGREIAILDCTDCHRTYWPAEFPPQAWSGILDKMGRRASLSEIEIQEVKLYFATVSEFSRLQQAPPETDSSE